MVPSNVGVHDTSSSIQIVRVGALVRAARTQTLEDVVRQAPDRDDRGATRGLIGVESHPDII